MMAIFCGGNMLGLLIFCFIHHKLNLWFFWSSCVLNALSLVIWAYVKPLQGIQIISFVLGMSSLTSLLSSIMVIIHLKMDSINQCFIYVFYFIVMFIGSRVLEYLIVLNTLNGKTNYFEILQPLAFVSCATIFTSFMLIISNKS